MIKDPVLLQGFAEVAAELASTLIRHCKQIENYQFRVFSCLHMVLCELSKFMLILSNMVM